MEGFTIRCGRSEVPGKNILWERWINSGERRNFGSESQMSNVNSSQNVHLGSKNSFHLILELKVHFVESIDWMFERGISLLLYSGSMLQHLRLWCSILLKWILKILPGVSDSVHWIRPSTSKVIMLNFVLNGSSMRRNSSHPPLENTKVIFRPYHYKWTQYQ